MNYGPCLRYDFPSRSWLTPEERVYHDRLTDEIRDVRTKLKRLSGLRQSLQGRARKRRDLGKDPQ